MASDRVGASSLAERAFAVLHAALLALIYGRLALKSWLRFPTDWDFLAYHLPGALATYGLTTYTPEPRLVAVIDGFPPLPRIVAGALVLVSGRHSAASALNVVGVAALVGGLIWLFGRGISLRWLLTALLGVPLFVHHFASGYVDLFAGAWLALALAALSALEPDARRPVGSAALLIAALGAAQLSKLQAWPVAGVIGAAGLLRLALLARAGRLSRGRALALAAALLVALAAWPARNLLEFGNPVYPVQMPFAPGLFPNAVMEADSGSFNLPRWLEPHSRPVRFAASVLEWNRWRWGERYAWTLDQGARTDPVKSPHHRLGGWFPWTVGWLVVGAALAWRRRTVSGTALLALALALAGVAFLPQSHELRYWLFAPLALAIFTARALARSPARSLPDHALRAALVAGAAFVLLAIRPFAIDARPAAAHAPRAARLFWASPDARADGEFEICNVNPNGIFYSGPTFREYRVRACYR